MKVTASCCASLPLFAAAVLSLHVPAAFAQLNEEDELALVYGDKANVSIATGSRQPLRRAPAVATVITAEDIAAMGATDIDEVLETVPGIHVSRNNQGYTPLYVIRGIFSEFNPQTLMLQNGVPMTTLFVGNRGIVWGGLPVENIARIEIIRGPGSALYGADAYSGVINIITKSAAEIGGTEAGVRAGSFNSRDGWIQHGGKLGSLDVAAYLRIGHTDGYRRIVTADAQTALDSVFGTHASLAPGPLNLMQDTVDATLDLGRDKWRLRFGYKLRDDVGTAAGVGAALDPAGRSRTERTHADFSWNELEFSQDWRMNLAASWLQYSQAFPVALRVFPPGAFGGSFPDGLIGSPSTWERQWRTSAVATYTGFDRHQLRLGVGHDDLNLYRTQELKNFNVIGTGPLIGLPVPTPGAAIVEFPVADSFLEPHRRKLNYVYVQDEWRMARDWALTAGVRHDHYSDVGGTTNPRLALVWDASVDVTAKLLYGRAFRPPAYTEAYSINNPVIRGNPNLKPETISTLEAALSWQARADTQLNLSLFRYQMKDVIRASDNGNGTATFNNIGAQHGHGMELEVSWDVSRRLRLSGHYAWQRSIDEASGQDAGYAPHHHLYARADWRMSGNWLLAGQVNRVADRRRAAGDTRPPVADYTTVDLTLRNRRDGGTAGRWEFAASVRNLFDADVREPSLAPGTSIPNDLPMAPRSVYLQASMRW